MIKEYRLSNWKPELHCNYISLAPLSGQKQSVAYTTNQPILATASIQPPFHNPCP